jgi:hypothetical protein
MIASAEASEDTAVKFAFYSSAWGENALEGLRLVALNQTENPIQLNSIQFINAGDESEITKVQLGLDVPALGYAEVALPYHDLVSNDECISRTMDENWRLVEISNYTLNPSVRNLIIEDTDSFRIYQCEKSVTTDWVDLSTNETHRYNEWVLYHFESRPLP